jgi:hypothetical protein
VKLDLSHALRGESQGECIREQSEEENMWTQEILFKRKLKKNYIMKSFTALLHQI